MSIGGSENPGASEAIDNDLSADGDNPLTQGPQVAYSLSSKTDVGSDLHALYVSAHPDKLLLQSLGDNDWKVSLASASMVAMRDHPANVSVGLLDLTRGIEIGEATVLESVLAFIPIIWVMIVAEETLSQPAVRRLIRKYCLEYIPTPTSAELVCDAMARARRMHRLIYDKAPVTNALVIGQSDVMQHLFRTVTKVASTTAPVLILGESGTGKELTANAIHAQSSRREASFIAINCGALPHSLIQSELFGYERGAFTGANKRRIGKIEAADKGTLFLDEIGDLPLESQANLLRFLQEGKIERLGSHETISLDVRVISATHIDIEQAVRAGKFRSDLFHRLCVLRIDQPPLRTRGTDIELLANHIVERYRNDSSHNIRGFAPDAIEALYNYTWSGNVRELINRVRRAVVMAEGPVITASDLELVSWSAPKILTLAQARDNAEHAAIEQAMRRNGNRLHAVAQELGISRVTLYRLMRTATTKSSA